MIDLSENEFWYIMYNFLHTILLYMAKYFPMPQEVYDETVCKEPHSFVFVPDHFKTQDMCNEAIEKVPWLVYFVPNHIFGHKKCAIR